MAQARKPLPAATPDTKPFWDGIKGHQLVLPKCNQCGELHDYPRPFCPKCFSRDIQWVRCSGRGMLYSYVINHLPAPGFEEDAPDVIAVVQLEEGPRMMANLTGVPPDGEHVQVDMPLEITYEDMNDQVTLFRFHPR